MITSEILPSGSVATGKAPVFGGNPLLGAAISLGILLAMILLSPLIAVLWVVPCLVPKKKALVLLIPRFGGALNGNIKHFFLYLVHRQAQNCEPYLLTHRCATARVLRQQGLPVLFHPSLRSIVALLRARSVVVESADWFHWLKSLLARHATSFQVWHGNGMKQILLTDKKIASMLRGPAPLRWALHWLNIYPTYDVVFFASPLQRERRAASFRMKEAALNGQPRNDVLFGADFGAALIGCDLAGIGKIRRAIVAGKRVILYSPTWRLPEDTQPAHALDLAQFNEFALRHDLLIVWKAHPKDQSVVEEREAIIVLDKDVDTYPVMKYADCMITDYSSIYMDYILLDRPILFFPYDRNAYFAKRGIQHDYDAIAPGPKCLTQAQLQEALRQIVIEGRDSWAEARGRVRRDFCAYRDDRSCERLFAEIRRRAGF